MDNICFVQPILNLTGFDILNGLGYIHGNGTCLGIGHQALRSQDFTEASHYAHHIRCRNDNVEIQPAVVLNLRDQLLAADIVRARRLRLVKFGPFCKYKNLHALTCSVRQYDCAADLLLRMTSVTACPDMKLDCLVEFCCRILFDKGNRLSNIVLDCPVKSLHSFLIFLSSFHSKNLLVVVSGEDPPTNFRECLLFDGHAHTARSSRNHTHRSFQRRCV